MSTHILIVEDEAITSDSLRYSLSRQGYEVSIAATGAAALERFRDEDPDLIVLDVMMPDKDGYAVARELAKDAKLSEIPLIMLTAVVDHIGSTHYSHADGKDLVADDYFQKPVDPEALVQRITELVG